MLKLKPFLLFLIPIFLVCVYASLTYSSLNAQRLVSMDRELTQLSIHQAQNFQAWSGVFSRYHFRHLGPFHFYYLAIVDRVLDFIPNIHARARWGALFFNTCALSVALFLLAYYFKFSLLLLFLSAFLMVTSKWVGLYFADYWNPNFVPTLTVLYIALLLAFILESRFYIQTSSKYCARKLLSFASLATFVAEVLAQIHIGVCYTVAGLQLFFFIKAYFILRGKITFKQILPYLLITVGISCVLWLPVIYDAYMFENFGNLGRLISFFQQSKTKISFQDAIGYFVKFISSSSFIKSDIYKIITISLFGLGTLSSFHILLNKKFQKSSKEIASVFLIFAFLILFSIMQVRGTFMLYMLGMGYLLLPLAVFIVSLWIDFYCSKLKIFYSCVVGCYFTIFLLVVNFYPVKQFSRRSSKLQTKVEQTINKIDFQDNYIYHFQFSTPPPYRYVGRVILEATLQGRAICVDREWGYRYGDALRCDYLEKIYGKDDFESREKQIEFYFTEDRFVDFVRK